MVDVDTLDTNLYEHLSVEDITQESAGNHYIEIVLDNGDYILSLWCDLTEKEAVDLAKNAKILWNLEKSHSKLDLKTVLLYRGTKNF